MGPHGRVLGVFCGGVASFVAPDGRAMTTGIRKQPVTSGILETDGLPGDASAEPGHHTADRTVHLFADENYGPVEAQLGLTLPRPAFGENITATRIRDEEVCVGDCFEVGEAIICVTQPTERCKTIGRSLGVPKILKVLHELEFCGFYARCVEPGRIAVGEAVTLLDRPCSAWPIKRLHRFMFCGLADEHMFAQVMAIERLSPEWKRRAAVMRGRLERGEPLSSNLVDL